MEIGGDEDPWHLTNKRKRHVHGHGPKPAKSRRGQWVEEDMAMDPLDTTMLETK